MLFVICYFAIWEATRKQELQSDSVLVTSNLKRCILFNPGLARRVFVFEKSCLPKHICEIYIPYKIQCTLYLEVPFILEFASAVRKGKSLFCYWTDQGKWNNGTHDRCWKETKLFMTIFDVFYSNSFRSFLYFNHDLTCASRLNT